MATHIPYPVNGAPGAQDPGVRAARTDLSCFGLRCPCGRWVEVAEDWLNLLGSGACELELQYPLTVECECGALISAQRLMRPRTPR